MVGVATRVPLRERRLVPLPPSPGKVSVILSHAAVGTGRVHRVVAVAHSAVDGVEVWTGEVHCLKLRVAGIVVRRGPQQRLSLVVGREKEKAARAKGNRANAATRDARWVDVRCDLGGRPTCWSRHGTVHRLTVGAPSKPSRAQCCARIEPGQCPCRHQRQSPRQSSCPRKRSARRRAATTAR